MKVTREILKNENFQNEIEEIVKFAETRKIELSVMSVRVLFSEPL